MLLFKKKQSEQKHLGKGSKEKKESNDEIVDDLYSSVELLPIKRIMNNRQEYIELKENGFMQILEIQGKDISSLGNNEIQRTLTNYYNWLTEFTPDFTIYVTTLPTDTHHQMNYLKHRLAIVRQQMKNAQTKRAYEQLQDREKILLTNIQTEEQITEEINNVEFILFLFGKTTKELDETVRKAETYGNGDFIPRPISRSKKEQILTQYNSMNDKL